MIVVSNVQTIPPALRAPKGGLRASGGLTSVLMDRLVFCIPLPVIKEYTSKLGLYK